MRLSAAWRARTAVPHTLVAAAAAAATLTPPCALLLLLLLAACTTTAGAAELAEALCGMPSLAALAIEGALLDAEGDWLRDTAGLLRHGRCVGSWWHMHASVDCG